MRHSLLFVASISAVTFTFAAGCGGDGNTSGGGQGGSTTSQPTGGGGTTTGTGGTTTAGGSGGATGGTGGATAGAGGATGGTGGSTSTGGTGGGLSGDHLLISEVAVAPEAGEFIEIWNPTGDAVDLTDYYLSDNSTYVDLASGKMWM